MQIIRNLNAKYEYAHLAQYLMAEVLPQFESEEFIKSFKELVEENKKDKKQGKKVVPTADLKTTLEST